MKIIGAFSVFAIFAAICTVIYLCPILKVWCPDGSHLEVAQEAEPEAEGAFRFGFQEIEADTLDRFYKLRQQILRSNKPDSILQITGFFLEAEGNPSDSVTLGFARAAMLRKLFPEIPDDRIELYSRRINPNNADPKLADVRGEFTWIAKPAEIVAATEDEAEAATQTGGETGEAAVDTFKIVALSDRELIYFPYKSTERIKDERLEKYLQDLAAHVSETDDRVRITGHTDNIGGDEYNLDLSKQRANDIYELLLSLGVPSERIDVLAKGKEVPMASNATEDGRAKNRRVEVEFLQTGQQ